MSLECRPAPCCGCPGLPGAGRDGGAGCSPHLPSPQQGAQREVEHRKLRTKNVQLSWQCQHPWQTPAWHSLKKAFVFSLRSQGCSSPSQGSQRGRGWLRSPSLPLQGHAAGGGTGPPALQPHQPRARPCRRASRVPPCPRWSVLPPTAFSRTASSPKIWSFYLMPKRRLLSDTCFWNVWCWWP